MIVFRPVAEQELPALADLYGELYHVPTELSAMQESYRQMASNPDYLVLGAYTETGDMVGSGLVIICRDIIARCRPWAVVENVIVSDRVRGQGLGRRLMDRLEQFAIQRGCSYIQLTSSHDREPAHQFYEAIGYSGELVKAFRKRLQ